MSLQPIMKSFADYPILFVFSLCLLLYIFSKIYYLIFRKTNRDMSWLQTFPIYLLIIGTVIFSIAFILKSCYSGGYNSGYEIGYESGIKAGIEIVLEDPGAYLK